MAFRRQLANHFKISHAICAILLVQTLAAQRARCQISDGDEQFEAVHQDIGRISGLAAQGSPQVAPKSMLVARQPTAAYADPSSQLVSPPLAAAAAPLAPVPAAVAQVFDRSGGGRSRTAGAARKPNRITLVARRDPLPSTLTTVAQPALIAAQLPAPPQQQQQQQQPPPPLVQEQPSFTPSFAAPASAAASQQPLFSDHQPAGPALSSFQSGASLPIGAPGGSVSARHSALMAQVAAERAAASGLLNEPAPPLVAAPEQQQQQPAAAHQHQAPRFQQASHAHQHHLPQAQPTQAITSFAQAAPAAPPPQHLAAPTTAQGQAVAFGAGGSVEEPLVAPSFEHVLGHGCPHKGVFSWENRDHCDRYYLCTNGTFTEEACPNGLAYGQQGAVYQHCAYNWNVDCGRKKTSEPIASPGCPWQFGLFPIVQNGRCSIDYFACEWGVPETKRCSPEGLFYDDRIKGCQWADQLGCKSEALLNFKCPPEDEDNPYWPYPRYYHTNKDVVVCVNEQPRLVHCNDDQLVDPGSLACLDVNKKKKKF